MQTNSESQLQLSIWRPVVIQRRYLYKSAGPNNEEIFVPVDDGRILEQIYSWDAGSNDIFAASEASVGQTVKQTLIDPFDSQHSPTNRSVPKLLDVVTNLLDDKEIHSKTYWTDCQEAVKTEDDEEFNLRANVAFIALNHIRWVASVFRDVPHASALIR